LNSDSQNRAIQQEINASLDAIDRIANDVPGVSDSAPLAELREGGTANVVDGDISAATEWVEEKLASLSSSRAAISAYERAQLDTFERIREDQTVIAAQTLSQIEDADFAAESSKFVQGKILSEAAIAALAFSNREQAQQMKTLLEVSKMGYSPTRRIPHYFNDEILNNLQQRNAKVLEATTEKHSEGTHAEEDKARRLRNNGQNKVVKKR